jgi:CelD/BcsL family acetyltransferase involved in cellulose biosynthesis
LNRRIVEVRNAAGGVSFGMLQLPQGDVRVNGVACILLSPGAKTRVAPHRLYRKLEGEFVARGIPVMRVDCQGFGDSSEEIVEDQLASSYDATQSGRHLPDAVAAMDCLSHELNVSRFILGGLCGGALTALYAAANDPRVCGLYSIGMPVAPTEMGDESGVTSFTRGQIQAEHRTLLRKAFRSSAWARFLTFKSDYRLHGRLLLEAARRSLQRILPATAIAAFKEGEDRQEGLHPLFSAAFFKAAEAGVPSLLLFGSNDRMLWNYKERFAEPREAAIGTFGSLIRVNTIEGANHVLSDPEWLQEARRATAEWLDGNYVVGAQVASRRAGLTIDMLSDVADFQRLQPEWNELLSRSRSNSVTLTWEWLYTWWQVYGERRTLRLVTVRENDRLIGAAPLLYRDRLHWYYGMIPFRRIELLASGESSGDEVCSDYIDWIALPGREDDVVNAVMDVLEATPGNRWDEIVLPDVWSGSRTLQALQSACLRRNLRFEVLQRDPCPYIALPQTWDSYLEALGSGQRYRIRRALRDFKAAGGTYEILSNPADITAKLDVLVSLHQQRWTAKGKPGAFASIKRTEFHRRLIPLALERGWLRLGVLSIEGQPIAAIYNFRYAGRVYFYQSGMIPQGRSSLRPGVLLHALEIQSAIAAGCAEYDFLKRGVSNYKDDWANSYRDLLTVRIARIGLKDRLLLFARAARSILRQVKSTLKKS